MTNTNLTTTTEETFIYSVLYRNDGHTANIFRVQPGQHAVREYCVPCASDAISQFNEEFKTLEFPAKSTVIAVFQGPAYDVSVMV